MIQLHRHQPRRRPNLTPMIDVVFLLLVFFMLVSQFGADRVLPLMAAGTIGDPYSGPPRLVELTGGTVRLNGEPVSLPLLVAGLVRLTDTPDDVIILRSKGNADVQALVTVMETLAGNGFTRVVLVEP